MITIHIQYSITVNTAEVLKENQKDLQDLTRLRMKEGIAQFFFIKKDGSTRRAFGTLNGDLIPADAGGGGNNTNEDVQRYYDIEARDWRTYTIENLIALV